VRCKDIRGFGGGDGWVDRLSIFTRLYVTSQASVFKGLLHIHRREALVESGVYYGLFQKLHGLDAGNCGIFNGTDTGNICLRTFTKAENNYAIALTFTTSTEDHLTDLLDFFISEIMKFGKFIALGTGGFSRSGNGRDSARRRRR
jgi:hypothetical protein